MPEKYNSGISKLSTQEIKMELLEFDLEGLNVYNQQDLTEAVELLEYFSDEELDALIEERQEWIDGGGCTDEELEQFQREILVLGAVKAAR